MVEKVENPKDFFDKNSLVLEEVVQVVRSAFGRNLDFDDIYQHVTSPERVYLLRQDRESGNGKVSAMASYNTRVLSGIPSLIVEGIAISPEMQGKGIFNKITDFAINRESVLCLRTQNPHMYRALEKYCSRTYPGKTEIPKAVRAIREDFASYLGCKIDDNGVVKGYYSGLFYGQEPVHQEITVFFKKLEMDLNKGDALLVIGIK